MPAAAAESESGNGEAFDGVDRVKTKIIDIAGVPTHGGDIICMSTPVNGLSRIITRVGFVAVMALAIAGCGLFGGKERKDIIRERTLAAEEISSIGINAYLWQGALETLDFMPMADVDSKGGVVLTDWYTNPVDGAERVKVAVYILDKSLRADALKVNVFKQHLQNGQWVDEGNTAQAAKDIADAILVQARRIRLSQLPKEK